MFKNYIATAWRNIVRHKMFAAINVFGLSLGISACLAIYLTTSFELSFNNSQPDKEEIYRIVSDSYSLSNGEDHSGSLPDPAPFAIRNEISGLESVAVFYSYDASVTIQDETGIVKKFERPKRGEERSDIVIAEPQYFDIFRYEWLAGDPATALKEPYAVVLTESKASLYFGKQAPADILHKTIIYNDSLRLSVSGIVKDAVKNTDFFFRDFISFSTLKNSFLKNESTFDDWVGIHSNEQVFVKLNKNVKASLVNSQLAAFAKRHLKQEEGNKTEYRLQPLSTIHFDHNYTDVYSRKASLPTLYGLMGIAVFILIIAIINFITLSTAQSIDRAKETGIRKVCGSTRAGLILRFLSETFILTLIAIVLSLLCIHPLLTAFRSFTPDGVTFSVFSFQTWIFVLVVALVTAVAAGLYPAIVLSSSPPAISVKGTGVQNGNQHGYFRKGLIVFQFIISLVFIISTIVIGNQMRFMLNKNLGFIKDAIISIPTNEGYPSGKKEVLAEKIRQLSEVEIVSVSDGTPVAKNHWFNPLFLKDKPERTASCILEWGDEHFIPLYDIQIIAGRNVQPSDTVKEFLINEVCVKALGFTRPEEVIGTIVETMIPGGTVSCPVVGVMRDFHSQSLHEAIKPVIFTTSAAFTPSLNVKLLSSGKGLDHFKTTIAKIEKLYHEVYPNDSFGYTFFDKIIERFYEKEQQTASLMNLAMTVAICISCLGLFGLATLTTRQRRKEIGIRKVLGAGIGNIVFLLNKDIIKLVLIAILIASPIALICMHQWLNGFAFRIHLRWWIFMLAGCIAILIAFCVVSYQSIRAALSNPVSVLGNE